MLKMSTIGRNMSIEQASVLATGHQCHQSATAPSLASHAADAVTPHHCYESDSDVIFPSEVK